MENQPFLLVELEDLSSIFSALKTTSRIKYTCFSVSNSYLIFGATSGGLYVFRREPCCFLQILPNKEGSVTQIAISPDEKFIAFATVRGLVCILEKSPHGARNVVTTSEHQNNNVTWLQWNDGSNELFIGDNSGKVSIVTVSIFPTKGMFQNPSFVLMQLDSKIVQMDFSSNMLLVSTLTKCYICDTEKEVFRQVGHKLRDGEFGACIFNTQIKNKKNKTVIDSGRQEFDKNSEYPDLSHLKLLCARPGSRIWEVAIDGTVISTHHFKEALAVPPTKIHFLNKSFSEDYEINCTEFRNGAGTEINSKFIEQSFNFQKLLIILPEFFLTYKSDGIYVFDPQKASVVLWNNEIPNIIDLKCIGDVIYVWSGCGNMYTLNLVSLETFLMRLYFQKKYLELAKLCLEYESFLLDEANNCNNLHIFHDLDEKLKSDKLHNRLKPLINLFKENAQKKKNQTARKIESRMYLYSNEDQVLLKDKRVPYHKYPSPDHLKLKGRSHSVSPDRLRSGGVKFQGSCSSLPDLVKNENFETPNEMVVNGGKLKAKIDNLEIDFENVLKILFTIKSSKESSTDIIFNLFEEILLLSGGPISKDSCSLQSIRMFPFHLHFNKEDIKIITDLFYSVLKSKALFPWLTKFTDVWHSKTIKNYPKFLIQNIAAEELQLDHNFSQILELFSSILEEKDIIELIKISDMRCYYASLNKILDIFYDSSASSLNLSNVKSTPQLLNRAYFLITIGQIEQCSKYSYKIDLHDLFYLMLKFEESPAIKSSDLHDFQCHTMFLSYLDKVSDEKKLIVNCNDLVELYIVNCLENISNKGNCLRESNCSCGFPNLGPQSFITMFPNVGHALIDKNWPKNSEKCLRICSRVPYLWKYLAYLRRNEPLIDLSPLLLQTGELQELENRSHEITESVLETYFKNMIFYRSGHCLNCNKKLELKEGTVTWTTFGTLCIKLLGPQETLKLYKKHSNDVKSKELNQVFFQSLIFSTIMERHNKGLRKNVVDLLVGKGAEDSSRLPTFSEKLSEKIFGKDSCPEYNIQHQISSHHWGVRVNFKNNCAVCSLPLETKVLISESGLVVFKCAHVFHSACLKKTKVECLICKKKSSDWE